LIRSPAVAGQFYPGRETALRQLLSELAPLGKDRKPALGVMSPHAGYIYSGQVAGKTLAETVIPEEVVILGPNHHGIGHPAAVFDKGAWTSPLGETAIAEQLTAQILSHCPMTAADPTAHRSEHSLEVQLPFLQHLSPQLRIAPVCISHLPLESLLQMGEGLAAAIKAGGRQVLIIASSDMTHFEPGEVARRKDFLAIERVLALDPEGLYATVRSNRISMCGVIPTVVMLQAARCLAANHAELVDYSNSGDVTGDQSDVVGYAGIRIIHSEAAV